VYTCGGRTISNTTTDGQNTAAFSSSPIPSLPPSYFIILKELQSLFPCAVPSDGTNIDETTSKLYECTPLLGDVQVGHVEKAVVDKYFELFLTKVVFDALQERRSDREKKGKVTGREEGRGRGKGRGRGRARGRGRGGGSRSRSRSGVDSGKIDSHTTGNYHKVCM